MNKFEWKYIWTGGFILAIIRGVFEFLRLYKSYPILTDTGSFFLQTLTVYFVIIGIGGGLLSWMIGMLIRRFDRKQHLLPIVYLIILITVDVAGYQVNTPADCRKTQGLTPQFPASNNARDLLLITIDTCRADYFGSYGHPFIKTPMLDKIARNGLVIQDAITSIPVTTPGHATIMTGLEPPMHGSRFNAVPIKADVQTLAEIFRNNGYSTGAFVSAFPVTMEISGLNRGFDIYDQLLTPSKPHPLIYRTTALAWLTRFGPFRAAERKWYRTVPSVKKWWSQSSAEPRFTWVHFYDPHFPYKPGAPFEKMYLDKPPVYPQSVFEIARVNETGEGLESSKIDEYKSLYMSEITAVDHAVEDLVRALAAADRLKNTDIIVTADHGESLDEHNYYFAHGEHLFEPSLKVPLIAALQGETLKNRVAANQFGMALLAGVICDFMNLKTGSPGRVDQEIMNIWNGFASAFPPSYVFCETGSGVFTAAHSVSKAAVSMKERAIRTDVTKLILDENKKITEYSRETDLFEIGSEERSPDFEFLRKKLTDYIKRVDLTEKQPLELPDEDAMKQLRLLGYID